MKRNNTGFTIYELIMTIAIIAILSAVAVPSMIDWRERAKLKGAMENLRADLQWAKSRAIRDQNLVAVVFETNRYVINNGAGATVRTRQLAAGVVLDLGASTVPADPDNMSNLKAEFNSRGRCASGGTLVLEDTLGDQRQVSINPLGQIRQE